MFEYFDFLGTAILNGKKLYYRVVNLAEGSEASEEANYQALGCLCIGASSAESPEATFGIVSPTESGAIAEPRGKPQILD
jgi:hypothetical protein